MRLIDADALERDGWQMSRTVQVDKYTMEWQTRKPTDFPTIEPQRMRGRWKTFGWNGVYCECSECGNIYSYQFNFCPHCGAWMGGQDGNT